MIPLAEVEERFAHLRRRWGRLPVSGTGWYFSISSQHVSLYTGHWYYWWKRSP